jgi:hypothetical protein
LFTVERELVVGLVDVLLLYFLVGKSEFHRLLLLLQTATAAASILLVVQCVSDLLQLSELLYRASLYKTQHSSFNMVST